MDSEADILHGLDEAAALQRRGGHAAALARLTACTARWPLDPRPHLRRAEILMASGQTAAAVFAARRAMRRAPKMLDARKIFARALLADGRIATACDALAAAVAMAPGDAGLRRQLGEARLADGRPRDALAALLTALRLAPDDAQAGMDAARLLVLLHRRDDAVLLLTRLLQRAGAPAALHVELARLLADAGQAEAALAHLPATDGGDMALARLRVKLLKQLGRGAAAAALQAALPDPPVEDLREHKRVLRAAEQQGGAALISALTSIEAQVVAARAPLDQRIAACFSLSRYWLDAGEAEAAFRALRRGHRLVAPFEPFNRAQQAQLGAEIIAQFSAARLHGPRAANVDAAPVFIVGMPRSGTTLAEQILASRGQVFGAGERQELGSMASRLGGRRRDPGWPARMAACSAGTLDEAAAEYLAQLHALAPAARYVVDKMPGNFQWLGLAGLMLPGAKIIHCVRDARDIGLSIYTRRFDAPHPYAHDLDDLGWYIAWQQRLMGHWRAVLPNPMLTLRLHDWIRDFPRCLRRVLAFLELPDDDNCAKFYALEREVRTASREQVRQPINDDGMGRWRLYEPQLRPLIEALQREGALPG